MVQRIAPVYVAIDASISMAPYVDDIYQSILRLSDELRMNPALGDQVRVALLAFADRAEILLPLVDLTELRHVPRLQPAGTTQWAPLFDLLSKLMSHDLRALSSQDWSVCRPTLLMITDGHPTDDWEMSYERFIELTQARTIYVGIASRAGGDEIDQMQRLNPDVSVSTVEYPNTTAISDELSARFATLLTPLSGSVVAVRDRHGTLHASPMLNQFS